VFYATPGTESFQQCRDRGLLPVAELALQRSSSFPVETADFSRLDLVTLFRICRSLNFLKARLDAQPSGPKEYALEDLLFCPILPERLPQAGECYYFPSKLDETQIGCWLARAFLLQRQFLGLQLRQREPARVTYAAFCEETSSEVINLFLESAEGRLLCGVKNHFAVTRLVHDLKPAEAN